MIFPICSYLFSSSIETLSIKIILARKSDLVSSPSSYGPPIILTVFLSVILNAPDHHTALVTIVKPIKIPIRQ